MSDPRRPVPQPGILEIALYEGGAGRIDGLDQSVKLSSNENPFGPSERAREAVARAAHQMHRYPPTDHAALREALGRLHGLEPQRIICGVGSDEIIHFLAQAYVGPGDEVIFTEHGFLMYRISTMAAGGVPVAVPERDRTTDVDAILAAVSDRTRLVFVANPNNPTGTMIAPDEIERLADGLPPSTILVIDAAYAEYVEGYDGGASLAATRPNVVMTRTLSKIYGLGGLRVGWAYGPQDIIDVLNRIRGPFNLSSVALAGAEAALADQDHVTRSRTENARLRHWLAAALAERDVPSDPSHANFVLARFADADTAKACDEALKAEGLIVRRVDGYNLPHCLRITIGDEPACRRVAHVIGRFMAERGRA